jgi:hypothetical protein
VDWINLAHDKVQRWALVNTIMCLWAEPEVRFSAPGASY